MDKGSGSGIFPDPDPDPGDQKRPDPTGSGSGSATLEKTFSQNFKKLPGILHCNLAFRFKVSSKFQDFQ